MARPATAVTLPNGSASIGTSFKLGGAPYNQPLPNGYNLTYSTDQRTLRNYTLIHLEPVDIIPDLTPFYTYTSKYIDLNEVCQNNIFVANYGVGYVNSLLGQTASPRWYKSSSDLNDSEVKAYFTNWGSQDATWKPLDAAPVSDYYNYTYPISNFAYHKVALFPYVEYDYRLNGVHYRTSNKTALYDFFNGSAPTLPTGATDIGLFFGYELVYGPNSDFTYNSSSSSDYTMYCLGKTVNISETKFYHFNRNGNSIIYSYVQGSYQFAYGNNVLLGGTTLYTGGNIGSFTSFIGEKSHMYESHKDTDQKWDDRGEYYVTTMGYGYEDGLAAALSKGLIVVETSEQKSMFTSWSWDTFITQKINEHTLKAIIDTNRVTENFKRGAEIAHDKQIEDSLAGKNIYDETPEYDPEDPDDVDPNEYVTETPLNTVPQFMNPIGKFNHYFALSYEALDDFSAFLSPSSDNVFDDILNGLKLYGENPMDFILGLRVFPFDITKYTGQNAREITFGRRVATGVNADLITDASIVVDMGSCYFRRYYKNFLDYEPYCTAKLYIPYCGEIDIPTSVFLGHTIDVKMVIDLSTGGCTAIVNKDGIAAYYKDGQIGVEIPVTGMNNWEYVKTAVDVAQKAIQSFSNVAQNAAIMGKVGFSETTGTQGSHTVGQRYNISETTSMSKTGSSQINPAGIIGGIATGLDAAFEFTTQPTPLQTSGSGMPYASFFKPQYCYFVVQQAVPMSVSGYGDDIGYACLERRKISTNDSYIVAQNPHVQPEHATAQETTEINRLLSTGVWR